MKKILLAVATIATTMSMANGITTVGAGLGLVASKNPITNKFDVNGTVNVDARHLVPVYRINSNTEIVAGGGGNIKLEFPKTGEFDILGLKLSGALVHFDAVGYGTAQVKYNHTKDLALRAGAKLGLGAGVDIIAGKAEALGAEKLKAKGEAGIALPINAVFGVDYKNASFDLELGTNLHPSADGAGASLNFGLNAGYSF